MSNSLSFQVTFILNVTDTQTDKTERKYKEIKENFAGDKCYDYSRASTIAQGVRQHKQVGKENISVHRDDKLNVREAKNRDLNPQDSKLDTNIEHIWSEILSRQREIGQKPG